MRSYRPEELFDARGRAASRARRAGAGGRAADGRQPPRQRRPAAARSGAAGLPRLRRRCARPTASVSEPTRVLGGFLRDVIAPEPRYASASWGPTRPPPTASAPCSRSTDRAWDAELLATDDHLAPDGRVMEVSREHLCEGWLEGYLLTGRHGLFNSYEAFIHMIDSMFNQHAKWLKVTREIPWRGPIASLNYLLSSHVWRQDHNGFSHQDPGFIDHVVNKKAEIVRVYFPPDANCLLSVADHCLRSRDYVNVIVAGKQPVAQLSDDRGRDRALHAGDRHLGRLLKRRRRGARCRARLRRRRADARVRRRGRAAARAPPRAEGQARERRRPDAPRARAASIRTAFQTPSSTRSSPPTGP